MLLAAFIWHMFAAVLGIGPGAADADEGGPAPSQRRGSAAQHRNKSVQLNAKLEMGERALFFFPRAVRPGDSGQIRGQRSREDRKEHKRRQPTVNSRWLAANSRWLSTSSRWLSANRRCRPSGRGSAAKGPPCNVAAWLLEAFSEGAAETRLF